MKPVHGVLPHLQIFLARARTSEEGQGFISPASAGYAGTWRSASAEEPLAELYSELRGRARGAPRPYRALEAALM